MNKKEISQGVFDSMPRIKEVWVTDDGEFHIHPNPKGERFEREEKEVVNPPKKKK